MTVVNKRKPGGSNIAQKIQSFRVKLDWRAYYQKFEEVHGGDPVFYSGRLLFRDGWQYSATSYAGPEYDPSESVEVIVEDLMVHYWKRRKWIVQQELRQRITILENLKRLQEQRKTVPIQQKVIYQNEETQKRFVETEDLDLESIEGRIAWLEEEVEICLERITENESK